MTAGGSGNPLSAPHLGSSAAENDGLGGVTNEFNAVILALAAHDLRQPLQVIIGASDLLALSVRGSADLPLILRACGSATNGCLH